MYVFQTTIQGRERTIDMKIKQVVYETIPCGDYPVVVGEISSDDGQYGWQLKFRFDVLAEGLEDRSLTAWASAKRLILKTSSL